ncbi:MAG TPA: hypothetical protein VHX13_13525 [Acidobacteriaceae bacterium]|jgi:hypothetical protein|nr:hypothetical protein [Acidobacteriaceae bacterium]
MKLFVSALLLAVSTAGFAQVQTATATAQIGGVQSLDLQSLPPSPDQTGCPVVLTEAHLNWPATYLPVTAAEKASEPNLALGFQNSSGKAIQSASITARFMGKASKYQLDASAFELHLTFSGTDSADKTAEQMREIRLPEKMYAYGVTRIAMDEVTFADGTLWTSVGHTNCAMNVSGSTERITK